MMSAESKAEHGVIQSSIGLLQERFRQLQRMKEERQTKQLVRLFSDYKTPTPTPTSSVISPIILGNSSSYFTTNTTATTTTTTTTTTTSTNNDIHNIKDNNDINNNINNIEESRMQNNENDDDDDDDEELQIFIPPNYMNSNKNRKVSCYSSPSTSSTVSFSSSLSSSSSSSQLHNNHTINLNDISLSLWHPTVDHCRPTMKLLGGSVKELVKNNKRPITSVVSTALTKCDVSQHFSDVDTTLHL